MTQSTLIFQNRNPSDGSFIVYPDNFSLTDDEIRPIAKMPKALSTTLMAIIELYVLRDSENTYNLTDLSEHLNIKIKTLYARIRSIEKLGVLRPIAFEFKEAPRQGGGKRVKAISLDLSSHVQIAIYNKADKQHKIAKVRKATSDATRLEYSRQGFRDRPDHGTTPILRQTSNLLIEQLVSLNKQPINQLARELYVTDSKGLTHRLTAHIKSHTRVINAEDLQNIYALFSITHAYHTAHSSHYLESSVLPENRTPVYVDDILRLRKKFTKDVGGHNRNDIRVSLESIKNTTYDIIGYGDLNLAGHLKGEQGYLGREFKVLSQCTPFTSSAPIINGDTVDFGKNAMLYIIEWPEEMFRSLIYGELVFLFPENLLSVNSSLFMLYLRFRVKTRNCVSYTESLTLVQQVFERYSDITKFKESLKKQFLKLNKTDDKHLHAEIREDKLFFNLWGYRGAIDFKANTMTVDVDNEEMLTCCGVSSSSQKAPTKENELGQTIRPLLKVHETLRSAMKKELSTTRRMYDFDFLFDNQKFLVSHYTSQEELETISIKLSSRFDLPLRAIVDFFDNELKKIKHFKINNIEIDRSVFEHLIQIANLNVNATEMMHLVLRRTKLHDEIFDFALGKCSGFSEEFQNNLTKLKLTN